MHSNSAERWQPIPGWPYSASDQGRVRNDRTGRILKPVVCNKYFWVNLSNRGKLWKGHVHTLVLTAFVGPAAPGQQCRHDDGDNFNNCLANLSWGTALQNSDDRQRHGRTINGERVHTAKLTLKQVEQIRPLFKICSNAELARRFGVARTTISAIKHGKSWQ